MSPPRTVNLAYRQRADTSSTITPQIMETQPPGEAADVVPGLQMDGELSPSSSGFVHPHRTPENMGLNGLSSPTTSISSHAPKRTESLRDRRARQRQAQSQTFSQDENGNPCDPTDETKRNTVPAIPPVTSIIPPPSDLDIPHLPINDIPIIATSSTSSFSEASKLGATAESTSRNRASRSQNTMDARKLTRIAQAMGLVSTGPSTLVGPRHSRLKRISVGERATLGPTAYRRKDSLNGVYPSPSKSGFSTSSRITSTRSYGTGLHRKASDVRSTVSSMRDGNGAGYLVQVIPPDHLFVPSGFTPVFNLADEPSSAQSLGNTPYSTNSQGKELKRWRKGQLLPLRGTMDGMVKDVVKEWGLPSGIGMTLYLVSEDEQQILAKAEASESEESDDYEGGMKITSEAWKILWADLFNPISVRLPISRESSPRAPSPGNLTVDALRTNQEGATEDLVEPTDTNPFRASNNKAAYEGFLTPASARSFQLFNANPDNSPGRRSSLAPSASASQTNSPPRKLTWNHDQASPNSVGPLSRSRRIVGKIEFDFDRSKAKWYEAWLKRRREGVIRPPEQFSGGLRPLVMGIAGPSSIKDESTRNLATDDLEGEAGGDTLDSDSDAESQYSPDEPQGYAPLIDEDETLHIGDNGMITTSRSGSVSTGEPSIAEDLATGEQAAIADDEDNQLPTDLMPSDEAEFAALRADRPSRDVEATSGFDIGSNAVLNPDIDDDYMSRNSMDDRLDDVDEVVLLLAERQDARLATPLLNLPDSNGKGLASPINIPSPQTSEVVNGTPSLTLSSAPERRLSIATVEVPKSKMFGLGMGLDLAHDKRGSSLVMSDHLDRLERAMKDLSPREIRLSTWGPVNVQASDRVEISPKTQDTSTMEEVPESKYVATEPLTPVTHTSVAEQDVSSTAQDTTPTAVSAETMARMVDEPTTQHAKAGPSAGWRPPRPARPPSPRLDLYTAPSPPVMLRENGIFGQEIVMLPSKPSEGMSPELPIQQRPRADSGKGKSLFGQIGGVPLNKFFQRKASDRLEREEDTVTVTHISGPLPLANGSAGRLNAPASSPTLSHDEFGTLIQQLPPNPSGGNTKSPKTSGFGRRLLKGSFGSHNRSQSSHKPPASLGNGHAPYTKVSATVRSPSNPLPGRGRTASAPTIESPGRSLSYGSSARSPKMVDTPGSVSSSGIAIKRKPVPRSEQDAYLPTSQSTISLASVLQDDVPHSLKSRNRSEPTLDLMSASRLRAAPESNIPKPKLDVTIIGPPQPVAAAEGQENSTREAS